MQRQNIVSQTELLRIKANSCLDPKKKSSLGQFFTPAQICQYMASLYNDLSGDITLLDPGCGVGSLTSAFVDESISRGGVNSISATLYDIDDAINPYLEEALRLCIERLPAFSYEYNNTDFILDAINLIGEGPSNEKNEEFTHVIMNPPYKKIGTKSEHRLALRQLDIESVNLYTGFVAIAIKMLRKGGELVAIIPRSFCNGPYYLPFRQIILNETSLQHIHIFDKRNDAFSDNDVLQENIIIHCVKGKKQRNVKITSSPSADFHFDEKTREFTATDLTVREVEFDKIVNPYDTEKFIHIASTNREQYIVDRLSHFSTPLSDLGLEVSTGPVVDFRLAGDLRTNYKKGDAPLLYPVHMKDVITWPVKTRKPNAIHVSGASKPWLWDNHGYFVIVRRFSSKEEKRRIVACVYDGELPGKYIGFENKLNVFHSKKAGIDKNVAKGLYVYLNSTLLDKYYRQFGGHTQINATDLRNIHYPDLKTLKSIGNRFKKLHLTQERIDELINNVLDKLSDTEGENPLAAQHKIDEALDILAQLGMPRAQQNERSALTLLALLDLEPNSSWENISRPLLGVTPIMDWCRDKYGKEYAPNTRETFRRQTLHQFVSAGIALYNPDKLDRPVNSPKACYQICPELMNVLSSYGTKKWKKLVNEYLENRKTLTEQYANARDMQMIPLKVSDDEEIKLTPGVHSELIKDIVNEFGPRFAPGAQVIYVGDTGSKDGYFQRVRLGKLGVTVDKHGKMPDVVLYHKDKNWLILIESVTSHGPVDGKRHKELSELFASSEAGLVYVTAFPSRQLMARYLSEISWETEVWTSDAPSHLIHFNGDRFLGPHK